MVAAALVAVSVFGFAGAASAEVDESVEVRIAARKLDGGGILLALQQRGDGESWGRRLLVEGAFVPSSAAPGRWFDSSTLTIAGVQVRISARRLDGGRVEFALQQRRGDGSWAGRVLPARRFVPASAAPGRWYTSSVLELAPESVAPSETEWTLLAGGDVLMDRTEPAGVDPFAGIEPPLASGDVAVVNVEMAITDRGTPSGKEFVFRAPSSAAQRIADAGIDVASLANNHAMDYGAVGLMDTVALLEDAGVVALGAGANDVEAFRHRVVEIDGDVTVAFVGVSRIVPWGFPAGPDKPGIASDTEPERVFESVRVASGEADVVVAVVHWGVEVATCPSADQREFAQLLFDAGAEAVIGHHPHVLQAIEFVDGKLVAYSLGNFVWHERWGISAETGVLQIDFVGDRIAGWTFHPHLLDENGAPRPAEAGWRLDRLHDLIEGDCERHEGTSPHDLEPPEPAPGSTAQPVEDVQRFSSQQFKELLDSVMREATLPNLMTIAHAPEITGDPETDERLRRIAEERGYALQPVVASSNELETVDEKLLQPEAAHAYRALREDALEAGHRLELTSGYRGFDVQRYLLFRHLKAPYTDARIYVALRVVAPPGYSRHQTGYAIDVTAEGYGINEFKHSEAYAWLAADDFLQARKHGFIPSYPAGIENQGPDPEPWEYVYIGTDNLTTPG